jgi:hypothetical protein
MPFWETGREASLQPDELEARLRERIALLLSSCQDFDTGREAAAYVIALHLRVLLHDRGSSSRSLLGQLGLKNKLQYYSSGDSIDNESHFGQSTLTVIAVGGRHNLPVLDLCNKGPRRLCGFDEWWTMPVMRSNSGDLLARDELVLSVADQEGAHVDPEHNAQYARFSRLNALGWGAADGGPAPTPVYAAARQVAHEILVSLALRKRGFFDDSKLARALVDTRFTPAKFYGVPFVMGAPRIGLKVVPTRDDLGNGDEAVEQADTADGVS